MAAGAQRPNLYSSGRLSQSKKEGRACKGASGETPRRAAGRPGPRRLWGRRQGLRAHVAL